jgi:hypothetical protein
MTLRTMFGRRVKGEPLKNLIEALGGDYFSYPRRENLIGKVSIKPVEKGFYIELAIKIQFYGIISFHHPTLKGIIPYSPKKSNNLEIKVQNKSVDF